MTLDCYLYTAIFYTFSVALLVFTRLSHSEETKLSNLLHHLSCYH